MPSLTDTLGLTVPIIQAPMAGGGDTPDLVAAVSNRGGLGSVGAAYLTAEQIAATVARVRALTDRPFGINLFAEPPADGPTRPLADGDDPVDPAVWAALTAAHAALGLQSPQRPASLGPALDDQITAALESGAAVLSFTFGILPPAAIAAAQARGMAVVGTATTAAEAIALTQAGVDAVVAQGAEAGGHRGTFLHPFAEAMIGTMTLVPEIVDAVSVPVIASGGIMDGRGIAAARALGAALVQLGTVFLTCEEAGVPAAYKAELARADGGETRITRAYSGRPARGIANRFMAQVEAAGDAAIPGFPLQNALTRPLRTAARAADRAEYLSLWAGQGVGLAPPTMPAAALIDRLMAQADRAAGR